VTRRRIVESLSGGGFPRKQPSEDRAEELARGAAAVVEGRWHLGTPPAVPGPPEAHAAHRLGLCPLLRVSSRIPYRAL